MSRLTIDAVVVQSVLGMGDEIPVSVLAERAFGSTSPVALSRTSRAVSVLVNWGFVEQMPPAGRALSVASLESTVDGPNPRCIQLWACIARMVWQRYDSEQ